MNASSLLETSPRRFPIDSDHFFHRVFFSFRFPSPIPAPPISSSPPLFWCPRTLVSHFYTCSCAALQFVPVSAHLVVLFVLNHYLGYPNQVAATAPLFVVIESKRFCGLYSAIRRGRPCWPFMGRSAGSVSDFRSPSATCAFRPCAHQCHHRLESILRGGSPGYHNVHDSKHCS